MKPPVQLTKEKRLRGEITGINSDKLKLEQSKKGMKSYRGMERKE